MKTISKIKLNTNKINKYIGKARDVFKSYIDPDFKNYGCNNSNISEVRDLPFLFKELTENMTFSQMFNKDTDVMSQSEIIEFCRNNSSDLSQNGNVTFFLFKVEDQFFVADVRVFSDGLSVYVHGFEDGRVWSAEYFLRLVVPQYECEDKYYGEALFEVERYLIKLKNSIRTFATGKLIEMNEIESIRIQKIIGAMNKKRIIATCKKEGRSIPNFRKEGINKI